jgi:galactofuranosylgalactofuranosylrhamnosyl-N-acetylglucosaminyl-diphospho-decaprenol beta-1,5/1,6-galactofuranosyltransferase
MADFIPGRPIENALYNADLLAIDPETGKRDLGERRVDADYNAWWSCLIPAAAVKAIGLPVPVFFQWDDIEFGYRAKKNGFKTVTLPGAAVWHADFNWKDLDEWNRYFSIRNGMICASLHGDLDPKHTARVIVAQVVRNLVAMQYGLTATVLKAAEDYLEGPKILVDGGKSVAPAIRALRAKYPDTKTHPIDAVPGFQPNELTSVPVGGEPTNIRMVLIRRLADMFLGKSLHEQGTVASDQAYWWHVSTFDTVAVTDASQEGVRLRKRDRQVTIALIKQTAAVVKRILAETPRVKTEYQNAFTELTSRENWARLYGLDDK